MATTSQELYDKALLLVKDELSLFDKQRLDPPNLWIRFKLYRALRLLKRTVNTIPNSWPSFWVIGKIYQRLSEFDKAFGSFSTGFSIDPLNSKTAALAIEASICAIHLGNSDEATTFAQKAVNLCPDDKGFHADFALALIIAGKSEAAIDQIRIARRLDPNDETSIALERIVEYIRSESISTPKDYKELQEIERKRRSEKKS